jgi:uncharacterized protein (DUF58 family)
MQLFNSDFLKRLEYLSLVSRRTDRGELLAQRRGRQVGSGIEFAAHRPYHHGDDLRYLDWNVYARYGELLLKRFQEERDLRVHLLIDASPSMLVGSPTKFDYARQLAAALAYVALANLDQVAVHAYAEDIYASFPLTRGKDQILAIMRFLETLSPRGQRTDLARSAGSLIQRAQRTGLVIVLSDFLDQAGFGVGLDALRHRGFEPHVIQIHAAQEIRPELLGDVELVDAETGVSRQVTITEERLARYRQLFAEFLEGIDRYCRNYALSCTRTTVEVPYDELLLRMMRVSGGIR